MKKFYYSLFYNQIRFSKNIAPDYFVTALFIITYFKFTIFAFILMLFLNYFRNESIKIWWRDSQGIIILGFALIFVTSLFLDYRHFKKLSVMKEVNSIGISNTKGYNRFLFWLFPLYILLKLIIVIVGIILL